MPSSTNSVAENSANTTGGASSSVAPGEVGYIHPEHGKLIYVDKGIQSINGFVYEDGTYVIKSDNSGQPARIENGSFGGNTMLLSEDSIREAVRKVKIEGEVTFEYLLLSFGRNYFENVTSLDLRGAKFVGAPNISSISSNGNTKLKEVILPDDFFKKNEKVDVSTFFWGSPELKLNNDSVSGLLKNLKLGENSERLFHDVGIEKLDFSTLDNSLVPKNRTIVSNLIGLKEIIFGPDFSFENYGTNVNKGGLYTFPTLDTDLSKVEKVVMKAEKDNSYLFFNDWIRDVQNKGNLSGNKQYALFKDGQQFRTFSEVQTSAAQSYPAGTYTIQEVPEVPQNNTVSTTDESNVETVSSTSSDNSTESNTTTTVSEGENSDSSTIHPEHGRLLYIDKGIPGMHSYVYEDGTLIMKADGSGTPVRIDASFGGGSLLFDDEANKFKPLIKKIKIDGEINFSQMDFQFGSDGDYWGDLKFYNIESIDLRGAHFTPDPNNSNSTTPQLINGAYKLTELILDKNLKLYTNNMGDVKPIIINNAPKLKLTNEQVTQLLKDIKLGSNYSDALLSNVGVERLDFSTLDNSKAEDGNLSRIVSGLSQGESGTKLREIVFGDKFNFGNGYYEFGDRSLGGNDHNSTSFSNLEKIIFTNNKGNAHFLFKKWVDSVPFSTGKALFKDGEFYRTFEDVRKLADQYSKEEYPAGVYTIGYYKEPTTETISVIEKTVYEKDENSNEAVGNTHWHYIGRAGKATVKTTYVLNQENGSVISTHKEEPVIVEQPINSIIRVAAKDKVVETEIPNRTRYVLDLEKDYGTENEIQEQGKAGREVSRTVYTVDPNNGNVSENTTTTRESEPQDKVVKVGGKTRRETIKDSDGRTVTTTTTYTVDETTGVVTPNRTTTYGTQKDSTEVHKSIPSPVRYEKDITRNYGEPNQTQNGQPGDEVTTTTYSVNPQDGTITPTVGKPVRVKEPTETVVKVAAKDKVVEREIPNRTRYVKDSEKDFGTENETQIQGHPGREVTRTVYTVNPTDGSTTENTTTTRESEPQDKVIRVGGKTRTETIKDPEGRTVTTTTTYTVDETTGVVSPTITKSYGTQKDSTEVHKSIPSPVRYEKDITRNYGEPNQTQNGQPGDEVTTTTYSVNPQDGTITPTVGQPVRVKEPTETVVKVAAKDKVVENEIPNRTRYVKDSEKDYGTENEIQEQGQPGREVTRTVYIVNPNDGFVTESSTISRESDPQDKVVKVGGKTKTEIVNEGNQTYKMITSYDVNPETGEVTSSTTKELIPNENYNPSVEVDDTDPVTIPENNNSTPSLKPKDEEVKPKVEKETNKEILNGSFVESNIEKKDNNLDSNKEEKEKTSKDVLTIEKLQKDSLEKINLDNNVQTISLNKSNNVNKNLKLNQHSSTSTDSPKAEISTVNNKPTTEVNKVENVSSSTPSEKVEKTPTVKAPINTGSHSETNILPILGLIGLSGALIVGSSRKRKED